MGTVGDNFKAQSFIEAHLVFSCREMGLLWWELLPRNPCMLAFNHQGQSLRLLFADQPHKVIGSVSRLSTCTRTRKSGIPLPYAIPNKYPEPRPVVALVA